ncbi:MAG: glycine cleavage T C-terminal barrel domain-containing protein [Acidobacteriota bacterium]
MTGYEALLERAAWIDLRGRGLIRVTGEDRARLLHAMSTNQIQELKPGEWCYTFFLSAQGRILTDAYVVCREDEILLDVEPERRAFLYEHLDKFIIADDVTLEDVSEQYSVVGVEGPAVTAPEGFGLAVVGISATGSHGVRIYAEVGRYEALVAELEAAGISQADADAVNVVRLENARPRYGVDITESYLVQETKRMDAVSFTKGCYLGQEIVERVRARANPHKYLTQVLIEGTAVPEAGAELKGGEAVAGKVTSAAWSPALGKVVALAYVQTAWTVAGKEMQWGEAAAVVSQRGVA